MTSNIENAGSAADKPIIIWTFRRTGGTSLRSILFWLSPFPQWQDEAYNVDRELGSITNQFRQDGNLGELEELTRAAVREGKNLKHCIETVDYEVSSALLRASKSEYRHIVLLRANEVERQLSLEAARASKVWGPEDVGLYDKVKTGSVKLRPLQIGHIKSQLAADALILGRILRKFHELEVPYRIVFFEQLYSGTLEERVLNLKDVCAYLRLEKAQGLSPEAFKKALLDRNQNTKDIYPFFENYAEAKRLIEEYTH